MNHGGAENGMLKAPYEQLEEFGIGARYIADAIRQAEDLGLVDCNRGGTRVASTYAHRVRTFKLSNDPKFAAKSLPRT